MSITGNPTLQSTIGTNYYGHVWLALANIAYTSAKDAKTAPTDITAIFNAWNSFNQNNSKVLNFYFPGLTLGAPTIPGKWVVDWGPMVMNEEKTGNANLMYVVSYRTSAAPDAPYFAAVVIRGTDIYEYYQPTSLCTQLGEDLDVQHLADWGNIVQHYQGSQNPVQTYLTSAGAPITSPAAIANGTWIGLSCLVDMETTLNTPTLPNAPTGNTVGVLQYVQWLAQTYPQLPIVVTGHSLGGCQTTAMGLLLQQLNPGAFIVPHPWAPPSAGNADWAAEYQTAFGSGTQGQVWWNTADVVPNAFQHVPIQPQAPLANTATLGNILYLWQPPMFGNGRAPDSVEANQVNTYINELGTTYTHLANSLGSGCVQTMPGTWKDEGLSLIPWFDQLCIQHFPPMYSTLASKIPGLAPFAYTYK